MRRPAALLAPLLVALPVLLSQPAFAGETVTADDWYAVYINGTKAGHAHTVVSQITDEMVADEMVADEIGADDRPSWVTTTDTYLKLARRGAEVELVIGSRVDEDADGRVTGFRQSQQMSGVEIVTEGRVEGDAIRLDTNGVRGDVAYPTGAVGPVATDLRVAKAGFEPGTRTTIVGFSTDAPGEGSALTFAVGEMESIRVIDRQLRLHKIQTTNSRSAARSMYMWMDGNARMHVSESDVPGVGVLRMVRTTEMLALSVTSAAEVFASSLIEPDRGIAGPRRARRATFRLTRADGTPFDAAIYAGEGQSAGPTSPDGAVDVTIEAWAPPADFVPFERPVKDAAMARYLAKSAYLETDDPLVREHAINVVGDVTDALACARRIETYVRSLVSDKSMDVGFATAAEVVRSREGDCSEHAMLCAALARVVGLPSRLVMGLVYVPGLSSDGVGPKGAFGYHMWTEVLVGPDRWFPIDAAIGGFDATHIAMAKSDLSTTSPVSQMILPLLEAIASLRIEVVDVRTGDDGGER